MKPKKQKKTDTPLPDVHHGEYQAGDRIRFQSDLMAEPAEALVVSVGASGVRLDGQVHVFARWHEILGVVTPAAESSETVSLTRAIDDHQEDVQVAASVTPEEAAKLVAEILLVDHEELHRRLILMRKTSHTRMIELACTLAIMMRRFHGGIQSKEYLDDAKQFVPGVMREVQYLTKYGEYCIDAILIPYLMNAGCDVSQVNHPGTAVVNYNLPLETCSEFLSLCALRGQKVADVPPQHLAAFCREAIANYNAQFEDNALERVTHVCEIPRKEIPPLVDAFILGHCKHEVSEKVYATAERNQKNRGARIAATDPQKLSISWVRKMIAEQSRGRLSPDDTITHGIKLLESGLNFFESKPLLLTQNRQALEEIVGNLEKAAEFAKGLLAHAS